MFCFSLAVSLIKMKCKLLSAQQRQLDQCIKLEIELGEGEVFVFIKTAISFLVEKITVKSKLSVAYTGKKSGSNAF